MKAESSGKVIDRTPPVSGVRAVKCRCGHVPPRPEYDLPYADAAMRCGRCGRLIGGMSVADTISMWNAAMQVAP